MRPEEIVDRLEPIEVGKADGKGRRVARAVGGDLPYLVAQPIRIAKTGQRIGIGHGMQIILAYVLRRRFSRIHNAFPDWL